MSLEDAEDLASGNALHEGNTVLVTEQNTDLRGHLTLLRSLRDQLVDLRNTKQHQNHSNRKKSARSESNRRGLTSATAVLTQLGGVLLYGSADDEIPFLRHTVAEPPLDQINH